MLKRFTILFFALLACGGAFAKGKGAAVPRGDAFYLEIEGVSGSGPVWAEFDGRDFYLRRDPDGKWKGLSAVDRDKKPGSYYLKVLTGPREKPALIESWKVSVADKKFPEQRLTVDESKVTLSKEDAERAAREREYISRAIGLRTPGIDWPEEWIAPVEGVESSPFGLERYLNGKKGSYHGGIDIAKEAGTPVKASAGGRVALTGDFFYTGNTVFLDHGYGLMTGYFHMSKIDVKEGDEVSSGAVVGEVGSTGRSTGAHLHWSAYVSGVKVNPKSLLLLSETP